MRRKFFRGRGKWKRRIIGFLAAALLASGCMGAAGFVSGDAYAATVTASYTAKHTGTNGGTQFTVPSMKLSGVCCQFGVKLKNGTARLTELPATSPYAKIAYYWGHVKGWEKAPLGDSKRKHLTMLMQYASGTKKLKGFSYVKSGACKKHYDAAMKASVPPGMVVYKGDPTNKSQDFVVWKWAGQGRARVVKKSASAQVMSAGYNFSGIRYGLYSARSTSSRKLATLTLDKNGNSSVSGWLRLGTYYLTETDTNSWFAKNSTWYTLTLKSDGQTLVQNVTDSPKLSVVKIVKKLEDGSKTQSTFTFTLRNTKYTNIVYSGLRVRGDGTPLSVTVPAGTYSLDESLGEDSEYADVTGRQVKTVSPGGTVSFTHVNRVIPKQSIRVVKNTDDGGSRAGYSFKITGTLPNEGTLSAAQLLEAASPKAVIEDPENYTFSNDTWKVDGEDLAALNKAALENRTGTYRVKLTNEAKAAGSDDPQQETGGTENGGAENASGGQGQDIVIRKTSAGDLSGSLLAEPAGIIRSSAAGPDDQEETDSPENSNDPGNADDPGNGDGRENAADPGSSADPGNAVDPQKPDETGASPDGNSSEENEKADSSAGDGAEKNEGNSSEEGKADDISKEGSGAKKSEAQRDAAEDGGSENGNEGGSEGDENGEDGNSGTDAGTENRDITLTLVCEIQLKNVVFDPKDETYKTKIEDRKETPVSEEGWNASVYGFTWYGAATPYKDQATGKNYTILTTKSNGSGYHVVNGKEQEGICPAFAGRYTAEELMTDVQKKRYREPAVQTKVLKEGKSESISFVFTNKAKQTPVRLRKISGDGKISGIRFRLTGKNIFGEEVTENHVTDDRGEIDFGNMTPGEYTIEETGFDSEAYINASPLDGYSRPAVRVTVTGEETEPITVEFRNVPTARVLLSKVDGVTRQFLPGAVFELRNLSKSRTEARFRLIEKEMTPQAEFLEKDENIQSAIPEDTGADGPAAFQCVMLTGLISGDQYEVRETEPPEGYGPGRPQTFQAAFDKTPRIVIEDLPSAIGTTANDGVTEDHVSFAGDTMRIVDTVEYENLIPGREYIIRGRLMDRSAYLERMRQAAGQEENATGEAEAADDGVVPVQNADGGNVEAETVFTPKEPSGTEDVVFEFSGKHLAGSALVVFETLFSGETEIVSHEDPDSDEQSINVPKLRTTAVSEDTKTHAAKAGRTVRITDTVRCTGLLPEKTYTVSGTLMDQSSGKALTENGRPVSAEKTFTAQEAEETVELTFELNGSLLEGKTAVAFEELRLEEHIVAEHKDLNDKEQSVHFPEIGTTAERIRAGVVRDTVVYRNLLPGHQYLMRGVLMDKQEGTEIPGTEEEKAFVPDQEDGEVSIDFRIKEEKLAGKEIVAFEKCLILKEGETPQSKKPESWIETASHEDLQDENQTVEISEAPQTGSGLYGILGGAAAIIAAAAIAAAGRLRRKRAE